MARRRKSAPSDVDADSVSSSVADSGAATVASSDKPAKPDNATTRGASAKRRPRKTPSEATAQPAKPRRKARTTSQPAKGRRRTTAATATTSQPVDEIPLIALPAPLPDLSAIRPRPLTARASLLRPAAANAKLQCPDCGYSLPATARFCRACGVRQLSGLQPAAVPVVAADASQAPELIAHGEASPVPEVARPLERARTPGASASCTNCNYRLPLSARFCRACGTQQIRGSAAPALRPHDEGAARAISAFAASLEVIKPQPEPDLRAPEPPAEVTMALEDQSLSPGGAPTAEAQGLANDLTVADTAQQAAQEAPAQAEAMAPPTVPEASTEAEAVPPQPATVDAATTKTCPACHGTLPEPARFCMHCGLSQAVEQPPEVLEKIDALLNQQAPDAAPAAPEPTPEPELMTAANLPVTAAVNEPPMTISAEQSPPAGPAHAEPPAIALSPESEPQPPGPKLLSATESRLARQTVSRVNDAIETTASIQDELEALLRRLQAPAAGKTTRRKPIFTR